MRRRDGGRKEDETEEGGRCRERMQGVWGAMARSAIKVKKEAGHASKTEKSKNHRMETGTAQTEVRTKSMRAKATRQQPTHVGNCSYSKLPHETYYFGCLHYKLLLHPLSP